VESDEWEVPPEANEKWELAPDAPPPHVNKPLSSPTPCFEAERKQLAPDRSEGASSSAHSSREGDPPLKAAGSFCPDSSSDDSSFPGFLEDTDGEAEDAEECVQEPWRRAENVAGAEVLNTDTRQSSAVRPLGFDVPYAASRAT
jgi:hypothetical protein